MQKYLKFLSLGLFISVVTSVGSLSAEDEVKDLTKHPAYPSLVKLYQQTNLDIQLEEFDQKPIKEKIIFLWFYKHHFDEHGLNEEMCTNYIAFLHNLFPHLKERGDTKVWSDWEKLYGRNKESAKVLTALRPKKKLPMTPVKVSLDELETLVFKANLYQDRRDYQKALPLWDQIYQETNNPGNSRDHLRLHNEAFGKRLDLKRLIRLQDNGKSFH